MHVIDSRGYDFCENRLEIMIQLDYMQLFLFLFVFYLVVYDNICSMINFNILGSVPGITCVTCI